MTDQVERVARVLAAHMYPYAVATMQGAYKTIGKERQRRVDDAARDVIAAMDQWQPIETAPRTGAVVKMARSRGGLANPLDAPTPTTGDAAMTDTPLEALIAKLVASEGSRELDVRIARQVGHEHDDVHGRTFAEVYEKYGWEKMASQGASWDVPFYTTSIDAALTLVEEGEWWSICVNLDDRVLSEAEVGGCSGDNPGISASPALAICIAALRARA